ncbi:hypothetical protein LOCC1_G006673 [Lachnellula occidentalis]|uniref:Uncharacterized protein n=1 Tax=Lachnellula occidentalis TaxID=215460 RepID=A0A8H8RSU4_9HELO|nr:hypothetical protein LOCC1_G006673 [Lachnellula occidentalis]
MQLTNMTKSLALLLTSTIVTGSVLPRAAAPIDDVRIGAVRIITAGIDGYELVTASFSGTYNGHAYTLSGDIDVISAQLETLYGPSTADGNVTRSDSVLSRDTDAKSSLQCIPIGDQGWQYAKTAAIATSAATLKRQGGSTHVNGHSCARLSCQSTSAIYLCNDNNGGIDPQLGYIASYAQDIISRCSVYPPFSVVLAAGQEFDTDHYNVIVREDAC